MTHFLTGTGARDETTTYSYNNPADPRGLLYTVTDQENRVTTFGYDAYGRQAAQVLPDGTTIASTFWGSGLPETTTEDPPGASAQSYTTWRSYNVAGLVETQLSPSGLETTTVYDPIGRPELRAAPDGQDTFWTRSPLGAVTQRSQAGRAPVETRLNLEARRLTYEETGSGAVFEAIFDPAGGWCTRSTATASCAGCSGNRMGP